MPEPVVRWFDGDSIAACPWNDSHESEFLQKYWLPMMRDGATHYTANLHTELGILQVDNHLLPITINQDNYDSSYVCSPFTHFVSYAIVELRELERPLLEWLLKGILHGVGVFLKWGRINRVVHINNWLLSTNLYPNLSTAQIHAILAFMKEQFPSHAHVFRSVNTRTCASLIDSLSKGGARLVATRQVYIFPGTSLNSLNKRQRRELRKDRALLQNQGYECVPQSELTDQEIDRCVALYNALYIEKYSELNPQFSRAWMHLVIREGAMVVFALKKGGRIDAVLGYFHIENVLTTPLFGYDTTVPQEIGLYRMLSALTLEQAFAHGLIDHASSGVAGFKRNRGYQPAIEYSGVASRHLPLRQRLPWQILEWLTQHIGVPLLQKFKL